MVDFAREIARDVIHERLALNANTKCAPPDDKLPEAASGLPLAIHVFLVHTGCRAREPSRCAASEQIEVWSITGGGGSENGGAERPLLLPMFLKQAIRSQLHFSPLKSWLSSGTASPRELPDGFACAYRISTSAHFSGGNDAHTEVHSFPRCRLAALGDGQQPSTLQVEVRWLRKERYPREAPTCPAVDVDSELWLAADVAAPLRALKSALMREPPLKPPPGARDAHKKARALEGNAQCSPPVIKLRAPQMATKLSPPSAPDAFERLLAEQRHSWPRPTTTTARRRTTSGGLLCNFEESALSGRLAPVSTAGGFRLQMAVVPKEPDCLTRLPQVVALPARASYFAESSSLYMGECSVAGAGRRSMHIPRSCTIQAVLFNPQGSVVRLFLVDVDVRDMPCGSRTFVRQRIGGCAAGGPPKFLIHLRLASDRRGRVHIHGDVRMLLSNRGGDLEQLERLPSLSGTALRTETTMPTCPKYSAI